jgi:hypothetical protein
VLGDRAAVDLTVRPSVAAAARWRRRRDGIEDGEAVSRASEGAAAGRQQGLRIGESSGGERVCVRRGVVDRPWGQKT